METGSEGGSNGRRGEVCHNEAYWPCFSSVEVKIMTPCVQSKQVRVELTEQEKKCGSPE